MAQRKVLIELVINFNYAPLFISDETLRAEISNFLGEAGYDVVESVLPVEENQTGPHD